jgi:hypothetical protein
MKNKVRRRILGVILLVGFLFLLVTPVLAQEGIVPCSLDGSYSNRCTLCHLITGIKKIFDYGIKIIAIITLACATFAGVMYIVSSGNEKSMESAKAFLKASLIGFAVVLGAWVMVNTTIKVLMPTKGDLGTGKTSWYQFGDINCSAGTSSAALEIITPTNTSTLIAKAGEPYSSEGAFSVTGGSGNYTWSATNLPPGLTIDPVTGVISGTSLTAGTYVITVTATDIGAQNVSVNNATSITFGTSIALAIESQSVSKEFILTIKAAVSGDLVITTTDFRSGKVGVLYHYPPGYTNALGATGGNGTYTWSVTGLPEGLEIIDEVCRICGTYAEIYGTPTEAGTFRVNVTVTSGGQSVSKEFDLIIATTRGKYNKEATCINNFCSGSESKLTDVRNGAGKRNQETMCCDGYWWINAKDSNWDSKCFQTGGTGLEDAWYQCD